MAEVSIPMSIPLDNDRFLRRECPNCGLQFKWYSSPPQTQDEDSDPSDNRSEPATAYFCPYCYEPAAPNAWWTQQQIEYAQKLMAAEVLAPQIQRLQNSLQGLNRSSGILKVNVTSTPIMRPEPLVEEEDMIRVDFPCHPQEPIKIQEGWNQQVACLTCGILYPVSLVTPLPEMDSESEGSQE